MKDERECTVCPDWVTDCVHFDGRIVLLAYGSHGTNHTCDYRLNRARPLVSRPVDFQPCPNEGCPAMLAHGFGQYEDSNWRFRTIEEARAKFHSEAEKLRAVGV